MSDEETPFASDEEATVEQDPNTVQDATLDEINDFVVEQEGEFIPQGDDVPSTTQQESILNMSTSKIAELLSFDASLSSYFNTDYAASKVAQLILKENNYDFPSLESPILLNDKWNRLFTGVSTISNEVMDHVFDQFFNGFMDDFFKRIVDLFEAGKTSPKTNEQYPVNILPFETVIENYRDSNPQSSDHLNAVVDQFYAGVSHKYLKVCSLNISNVPLQELLAPNLNRFITHFLGLDATLERCGSCKSLMKGESYDLQLQDNFYASLIFLCSVYKRFYVVHLGAESFSFIYNSEDYKLVRDLSLLKKNSPVPLFNYSEMSSYIKDFVSNNNNLFDHDDNQIYNIIFTFISNLRRSYAQYFNFKVTEIISTTYAANWSEDFNDKMQEVHKQLKAAESGSVSSAYGWS